MPITYKLPKIAADSVVILDTPVAGDTDLSTGVLSIKDEAGNVALKIKATDFLSFSYDAYAAGTANIVDVDLTAVTMVANSTYVLTVNAPYAQNFFGGGQETGAIYQTRTYRVAVDATPTVAELQALFVARINADTFAYFSASSQAGDVVRITADSALAGPLAVVAPTGATIADNAAWVEPVGTVSEALQYVNDDLVTAAGYNRYIISFRKPIAHNAVSGLQVIKPVKAIVYIDKDDAGAGAAVTLLTSILDGSYATTADYFGCPAV
jgi:hypothetical protein